MAAQGSRHGDAVHFTHIFTKESPGDIHEYYTLDKTLIGEGSFGIVCRGVNKSTGAERAIKAVNVAKINDVTRFEQEIKIQQLLDHPNICKLHEVIKDAKKYYLVMELCKGGELFDRIEEEASKNDGDFAFTEVGAATYMRQILGAMNYLHQCRFVHRDIKPENFLLQSKAPDAEIKVIDFGLATSFPAEGCALKTRAGTAFYVAPQVLAGSYDEKCDIWSCGVIAYILLSGYPPFHGDTDNQILRRVKRGRFEFPSPEWDNISASAKDFISQMLTYDPKPRPTAEAMLVHDWLHAASPSAHRGTISKDLGSRLKKFRSSSRIKKAALSVIAKQLSDEDVQELKGIFQALDQNQDGFLSPAEIREGMAMHNIRMPHDLEGILRGLDTDGSGRIDYTEFLASTLTAKEYLKEDVMRAAFHVFDQDGNGSITGDELAQVLKLIDPELQGQMMGEADLDGDGKISYEEFCKMLKKERERPQRREEATSEELASSQPTVSVALLVSNQSSV
eukprot:CAMPEP_0171094780 /NCGR_PEP_ID=MMETSP0766_2-20121228/42341_1 /TAXON_ID=439317 /ORGANISM="Gambierdiscus australes, Strain CAWD 149" /LENGTH=506 /DNA_ID=CAMNT_0011553493 /DNA_START=19 /DNA_END=1540 /DNA_ORIENTATION=-